MTSRVTASYADLPAAREAVHTLVEEHIDPRRIQIHADLGGTTEHLDLRLVPRDRMGAAMGFLAGMATVGLVDALFAGGIWLPRAFTDLLSAPLGAPALLVGGSLFGMLVGVLWGLGRLRLRIQPPSRRPQAVEVAVHGPEKHVAKEILGETPITSMQVA